MWKSPESSKDSLPASIPCVVTNGVRADSIPPPGAHAVNPDTGSTPSTGPANNNLSLEQDPIPNTLLLMAKQINYIMRQLQSLRRLFIQTTSLNEQTTEQNRILWSKLEEIQFQVRRLQENFPGKENT